MIRYTIERHNKPTKELCDFILAEAPALNERFGSKFNFKNCDLDLLTRRGLFLVVKRDDEIRGWMIAFKTKSCFDTNVTILQQQSFFVKPDSGRAAYHLFKKFIDIGKSEANHIITMLTSETNIKPETLNRLGFKEVETLYRLEG